jgi:hypothetical protein
LVTNTLRTNRTALNLARRAIFCLGWLAGLGAAQAQVPTVKNQDQESARLMQWRHYQAPKLRCSFAYPPQWHLAPGRLYQFTPAQANQPNGFMFTTPQADSSRLCLRLAREPNPARLTAQQLLEQVARAQRLGPGQLKRGRARAGQREFLTLEFTQADGITHRHYFFASNRYIWWLDGQFAQADWAQFSPLLTQFFLKIKI